MPSLAIRSKISAAVSASSADSRIDRICSAYSSTRLRRSEAVKSENRSWTLKTSLMSPEAKAASCRSSSALACASSSSSEAEVSSSAPLADSAPPPAPNPASASLSPYAPSVASRKSLSKFSSRSSISLPRVPPCKR